MKSTKYTNFCLRIFGKLFLWYNKKPLEEKNILFVKANIPLSYEEYYSTALMNTILGFIISLIFALSLSIQFLPEYALFFSSLVPFLVTLCVAAGYMTYPSSRVKRRGLNINLFLPYAINFISSMAVAGISPAEIFETLATVAVYGEVQIESKKINKEIKTMGMDNITALKHAIDVSPSRKFKAFLQGIIGTIQSGSDLHVYLANVAGKYMEDDLVDRKRDLDLLSVIAEVLVLSVIAFPILLVIILTVMGFFGGSMDVSLTLLLLFSFLILPVVYAMFYFLIKSTSVEQLRKVQPDKNLTFKDYYSENKKSLFIFLFSVSSVVIIYLMINLLGFLGFLDLNLFLYWDLIFISSLILVTPLGIYNYLLMKQKKEMQDRLPEFLIDVGDSLATGRNIFDSIKTAEKGNFGKLDPEIKKMKTQLSWNISMKSVLSDFASRMRSAIIERIIIAIDKGLIMGGNTPKIFKAAAKEVDQVNQVEYQRRSIMSIYALVMVVCFFVFLAIILILNGTIYTSFLELQEKQAVQAVSVLKISTVDPAMLRYTLFSFTFTQSIGAGILAGFMMDGRLSSGVRYSFILGIITIIIFKTIV
jgi:archaellum biogenesis protein FlaJ (TadC family)